MEGDGGRDGDEVVFKVVFPDPDLVPQKSEQPLEERLRSFRRKIEMMSVQGELSPQYAGSFATCERLSWRKP